WPDGGVAGSSEQAWFHRWDYQDNGPTGSQRWARPPGWTTVWGAVDHQWASHRWITVGAKPPRLDHRLFHRQPHHHIPTFTQPTGTALGERWAGATTMSTPPIRMEDELSVLSEQIPTPTPPPQLTKVELTCSLWFENPFTSPPAGSPLSLAKNFIRQTLTNSRVETYNLEHVPADSKVIDLSLVRMTSATMGGHASQNRPEKFSTTGVSVKESQP
ncbi:hypothetical protein PCASD_26213, partial [Puccinia coronata f. sp. avenae]